MPSLVGVAEPGDESEKRHGHGHAKVGHHLAIVGKGIGNIAVKQAEKDHEKLACGIALGIKKNGDHADQGGDQRQMITAVEEQEGCSDQKDGGSAKRQFRFGKIRSDLF